MLTRHAERDRIWWPEGVEAWTGDVSDEESIRGAGDGLRRGHAHRRHRRGRCRRRRRSSRSTSKARATWRWRPSAPALENSYTSRRSAPSAAAPAYHKSKCVAEEVVRAFSRDWLVVRPGAVYGPGDEHISVLLRMVQIAARDPDDRRRRSAVSADLARGLRARAARSRSSATTCKAERSMLPARS